MPLSPLTIRPGLVIPASDLEWTAARASGPGGQNVNKVSSKVDLRFDLAGTRALDAAVKERLRAAAQGRLDAQGRIQIVSQATRDQHQNLEDALERLRLLILSVLAPPKRRRATRPTRGAKERRLEAKRRASERKRARRGGWDG